MNRRIAAMLIAGSAGMVSTLSYAQADNEQGLEEVTVTGSRVITNGRDDHAVLRERPESVQCRCAQWRVLRQRSTGRTARRIRHERQSARPLHLAGVNIKL